mgnify:CR=1 FL=1
MRAAAANLEFERAAPRRFDLVIGADGTHSNVRRLVFGPEQDFVEHAGLYVATLPLARQFVTCCALQKRRAFSMSSSIDTAITRAQRLCVLVGERRAVAIALARGEERRRILRLDPEGLHVLERLRHARHDRQAAELAWGRATDFFKKHLG